MCKCRLHSSICNDRQSWNNDKCKCECKEWIDKGRCGDGFIWNPSTYGCVCDKSCDIGEYLDYVNCKCKKPLINKLVEKYDKDNDGNGKIYNATLYDYRRVCKSCTLYVVLLIMAFIINMGISGVCFYFVGTGGEDILAHYVINLV